MKEIGGYIELDTYTLPMLHENAIKLNCGRNALAYLIEGKGIKKIAMPKFMCDACNVVLRKYSVIVRYYSIGFDFKPVDINLEDDEWLYLVNYYGQISNVYISDLKTRHNRLIVDNSQAYFQRPVDGVDTIYTCRKFFGVPDGALMYTDTTLARSLVQDKSFNRMNFLLGRFERNASEFYNEYKANNEKFFDEPIKKMSRLTENLLHAIDYEKVQRQRTENFFYLYEELKNVNALSLTIPKGAFMYPLFIKTGKIVRESLQAKKIYIPTLWPEVLEICNTSEIEYDMASNILPLPVDQRYSKEDMAYMVNQIRNFI
ncbi:Uncharacterised protein [uncultured Blautia sp.]